MNGTPPQNLTTWDTSASWAPARHPCQREGLGLDWPTAAPAVPTDARPGTPEKIAVLAARAERDEELWHPEDLSYLVPNVPQPIRPKRKRAK
jgi:hypothetical protein